MALHQMPTLHRLPLLSVVMLGFQTSACNRDPLFTIDAAPTADGSPNGLPDMVVPHPGPATWPMFRNGPMHQGRSVHLGPQSANLKWSVQMGGPVAVAADGTVYAASSDKNIYAIDPANGTKRLLFKTAGLSSFPSPSIGTGGVVYLGARSLTDLTGSTFYALDPITGTPRWSFEARRLLAQSAVISDDGTICMGTENGNGHTIFHGYLYAVDAATGHEKWSIEMQEPAWTTPSIENDTVYAVCDGDFCAIDKPTGSVKWSFGVHDFIQSSPAIGDTGMVYFGAADKSVHALITKSGQEAWSFHTSGEVRSSPAIGIDGTIYVGSDDHNVYALDGSSGKMKWSFATNGPLYFASPTIGADNTIYFGSSDHNVYAVDGTTGQKKWAFSTGGAIRDDVVIGGEHVAYVNSEDGKIYAIGP